MSERIEVFDDYIPEVTVNNIFEIPFREMLDGISPYALEEVPEGTGRDPDVLHEIDMLLGRFANLYSYLIHLYAAVANEANRLQLSGATDEYKIMVRKKEALYEIARSVRYKHEAVSRMLTVYQEEEEPFERPNYQAREERQKKRRRMKEWGNVTK